MSARAACGVALALLAAPLCAQVNSPERLAAWAQLPDWSGQWEMGPPPGGPPPAGGPAVVGNLPVRGPGLDVPLPFNAAWQAKYDTYRQSLAAIGESDAAPDTTVTECIWGLPRMQLGPALFEITVTPEETMIDSIRARYDISIPTAVHIQPICSPAPWATPSATGRARLWWSTPSACAMTFG
jgi:hypothetical protein